MNTNSRLLTFFTVFIFLLPLFTANSQTWDFNGPCDPNMGTEGQFGEINANNIFNGCFPEWISTSGSPWRIEEDGYINLWLQVDDCEDFNVRGEGVALFFEPGISCGYDISFQLYPKMGSYTEIPYIFELYAVSNPLPNNWAYLEAGNCEPTGDVIPEVPINSQLLWSKLSTELTLDEWNTVNLSNVEIAPSTKQLWVRVNGYEIDQIDYQQVIMYFDNFSISECIPICNEPIIQGNRSACPKEGKYGLISVELDDGLTGDFTWSMDLGVSASIQSSSSSTILYDATPGVYNLAIVTSNGCTYSYSFTVKEKCCEDILKCRRPQDLSCLSGFGDNVLLYWQTVPNAQRYLIKIISNNPDCGSTTGESYTFLFEVEESGIQMGPSYLPSGFGDDFSWEVAVVCENGITSDYSFGGCVKNGECNSMDEEAGKMMIGDQNLMFRDQSFSDLIIYPNPTSGSFTLEFTKEVKGIKKLSLHDMDGKVLQEIKPNGNAESNWSQNILIEKSLSSGVYILRVTLDDGSFVKQIILTK